MSSLAQDISPEPIEEEQAEWPGRYQWLRRFIEVNYFYIISAFLMMLGCYLLVEQTGERKDFLPSLKALLVLQGYEVLVIATAVFIVHRFRKLDDAFTLLLIELVLLLDPTFFNGNFFATLKPVGTQGEMKMLAPQGIAVNAACFWLVLAKLFVLQGMLRLRLSARTLAAFSFAAIWIYLLQGMLNLNEASSLERSRYYYFLDWLLPVFIIILPAITAIADTKSYQPDFVTSRQEHWLPRLFIIIPLVICFAHIVESAPINDLLFLGDHLVPLFAALAILLIKNTGSNQWQKRCYLLDALVLCSLLLPLSAGDARLEKIVAIRQPGPAPFAQVILTCINAVTAMGIYGYAYSRSQYRPILYRLIVLVTLGAAYGIIQAIDFAHLVNVVATHVLAVGHTIFDGPIHLIGRFLSFLGGLLSSNLIRALILWIILLPIAIRFRNGWTHFLQGVASIWLLFELLPGRLGSYVPEIIQACLVLALYLHHRFEAKPERGSRYVIAGIIAMIGCVRFSYLGTVWPAIVVAVEVISLISAGILLAHLGYVVLGALQAIYLLIAAVVVFHIPLQTSHVVVILALTLFAFGILVTFKKNSILNWLRREAETLEAEAAVRKERATPSAWSFPSSNMLTGLKKRSEDPPPTNELRASIVTRFQDANTNMQSKESATISSDSDRPSPTSHCDANEEVLADASKANIGAAAVVDNISESEQQITNSARVFLLIESIFVTSLAKSIFLVRDMPSVASLPFLSSLDPAESAAAWFPAGRCGLALTDRRLLFEDEEKEIISIRYPQIAKISRQLATLFITGHADQVFALTGLSMVQAQALKIGLEKLLAELAFDQPEEAV